MSNNFTHCWCYYIATLINTSYIYACVVFTNSRNLPAKSASEEKKHRKQYEAMVAEAKKKGRKVLLIPYCY